MHFDSRHIVCRTHCLLDADYAKHAGKLVICYGYLPVAQILPSLCLHAFVVVLLGKVERRVFNVPESRFFFKLFNSYTILN